MTAPLLLLLLLATAVSSFAPSPHRTTLTLTTTRLHAAPADVIVISPPGGIGEITVLESAKNGDSVKWFVVSSDSANYKYDVSICGETMSAVQKAGGSLELAGADCADLLSREGEAMDAVSEWCAGRVLVCTYDGADEEGRRSVVANGGEGGAAEKASAIRRGIRAAARRAASASVNAVKIAALYSEDEPISTMDNGNEKKGGGGGLLDNLNLFKSNNRDVPDTLAEALDGQVSVVRYGELFGAAESSVSITSFYFIRIKTFVLDL